MNKIKSDSYLRAARVLADGKHSDQAAGCELGEIVSSIPPPALNSRKEKLTQQFKKMKFGDSFYIPPEFGPKYSVKQCIRGIARKAREEEEVGFFVSFKDEGPGFRVWKTN